MFEVRELRTAEEKDRTRSLYEQAFEDPKVFVDYYYREKCSDNRMFAIMDRDRALSMVHLNPFRLSVCGRECPGYFLVAVATDEACRHQGMMTAVLEESYRAMKEEHIPFCWLIPVDPAIYQWMGFEIVADFQKKRLPYEQVQAEFDVYCLQDDTYRRRAAIESKLDEDGASEVLPDHPVIMAKIIDGEAFDEVAQLKHADDAADAPVKQDDSPRLNWLKNHSLYFCEEV
jgi:hypothetical protein